MNEKFFDLKKEKQDRMINASLKIFAENGYAHASTDDIVKEAGISKGLLFHYFTNKIGLYSFIYDFAARYVALEMTSSVDRNETDFFGIHIQIKNAEAMVMKGYPYMVAFLNSAKRETVAEAVNEIYDKLSIVPDKAEEFFRRANMAPFRTDVDIKKLNFIIDCVSENILSKTLKNSEDKPENYSKEMKEYLYMLKAVSYSY